MQYYIAYDADGKVYDFGALEVQAVYISGNVREPFAHYMADCRANSNMDWSLQPNSPRPDFLSSSRKRLAPQLLYKGGIIHEWKKKIAVALDKSFFDTLPQLKEVDKSEAEVAWLVYDLDLTDNSRYTLKRTKVVYTKFAESLNAITRPRVGCIKKFMNLLQEKVDEKLESSPTNKIIDSPIGQW